MDAWQDVHKGLFVVDADAESARFLDRMVGMARRNDASLTFVHCLEEPSRWSSAQAKEVHALLKREWQSELDQLVAAHGHQGMKIDSLLLTGDPMVEIASLVERSGYDFVTKVASDQEEQGRLSSTDIDLIRSCPCSVWIDRAPAGDRYQNILVAVDCMNPDDEQLNNEMIAGALRFCEAEGATLHMLHVWEFPGETMMRGRAFATADKVDAMVEEERRLHAQAFDALLEPYASRLRKHLVKGRPITVVMELGARCQIDALVMGAGERTGIAGWLLGSSAEQMLKVVPCTVYARKPRKSSA
jgi:nucleotide-binding universal stress UspA family protein